MGRRTIVIIFFLGVLGFQIKPDKTKELLPHELASKVLTIE